MEHLTAYSLLRKRLALSLGGDAREVWPP